MQSYFKKLSKFQKKHHPFLCSKLVFESTISALAYELLSIHTLSSLDMQIGLPNAIFINEINLELQLFFQSK